MIGGIGSAFSVGHGADLHGRHLLALHAVTAHGVAGAADSDNGSGDQGRLSEYIMPMGRRATNPHKKAGNNSKLAMINKHSSLLLFISFKRQLPRYTLYTCIYTIYIYIHSTSMSGISFRGLEGTFHDLYCASIEFSNG